jgi:hypothetical protein
VWRKAAATYSLAFIDDLRLKVWLVAAKLAPRTRCRHRRRHARLVLGVRHGRVRAQRVRVRWLAASGAVLEGQHAPCCQRFAQSRKQRKMLLRLLYRTLPRECRVKRSSSSVDVAGRSSPRSAAHDEYSGTRAHLR